MTPAARWCCSRPSASAGRRPGRNGGFCSASLTHGKDNGEQRFPDEIDTLERLGRQNLTELESSVGRYGIDCDFELTGSLSVATEPHQVAWLQEAGQAGEGEYLDREAIRAEVDSPTYLAGLWTRDDNALVDPARLAWGLADAAERLGVRIHEDTHVADLDKDGSGMVVRTASGHTVRAGRVALGTNAFPSLVKRVRWHTVPVYDYALMTEPLSAEQLASIGWRHRQGIDDCGNQFHYYRLTPDNRILWGGYDAIYHFGRRISGQLDHRPATFDLLARQFFETFPQLEGLRFSHQWGGAIDTCTRFFAFYGTAYAGRAAYALGYTGLGVGATRFGANVMLDLLDGARDRADRAGDGAQQAAALPARAVRVHRGPADALVAGRRRPQRRPSQPVAEVARQARPRLRLVIELGEISPADVRTAVRGPPALARLERRLVHGRPLARGRAPLRRGRRRGRRGDGVDR